MPQLERSTLPSEPQRPTSARSPIPEPVKVPSIDQVCWDYWDCGDRMHRALQDKNHTLARMITLEYKKKLQPNLRAKCMALVESRLRLAGKASATERLTLRIADDAIVSYTRWLESRIGAVSARDLAVGPPAGVSARENLLRCVDEAVGKWLQLPADAPCRPNEA